MPAGIPVVLIRRQPGEADPVAGSLQQLSEFAWSAINRLAAYALLNLLDDPAMLALAFCSA